jgi:hypothetical protein
MQRWFGCRQQGIQRRASVANHMALDESAPWLRLLCLDAPDDGLPLCFIGSSRQHQVSVGASPPVVASARTGQLSAISAA